MMFMSRFFLKVGCAVGCGLALFADGTEDLLAIKQMKEIERITNQNHILLSPVCHT